MGSNKGGMYACSCIYYANLYPLYPSCCISFPFFNNNNDNNNALKVRITYLLIYHLFYNINCIEIENLERFN